MDAVILASSAIGMICLELNLRGENLSSIIVRLTGLELSKMTVSHLLKLSAILASIRTFAAAESSREMQFLFFVIGRFVKLQEGIMFLIF